MDRISREKRSEIMSRIRGKNTKIEIRFRKALWRIGLRGYRLHYGKMRIDIAFPKRKIAIFLDGCFWHGCPEHYREPKSNREYWIPKIEINKKRDRKTNKELKKEGWKVIRTWEHDLRTESLIEREARRIAEALRG